MVIPVGAASAAPRQITSLDFDWRFHRGDIPGVLPDHYTNEDLSPSAVFLTPAYDDSAWQKINVPHDYIVEGTFDPKSEIQHGYLPVESGWYRKTISIPAADQGRRLWLEFDGVYRDSQMWLNGHFLGRHASGYTSFYYDVSDFAKPARTICWSFVLIRQISKAGGMTAAAFTGIRACSLSLPCTCHPGVFRWLPKSVIPVMACRPTPGCKSPLAS